MKNKLNIIDCEDLCKKILLASDNGKDSVVIVGDYDTICGAFNYLMKNTDSEFVCGRLEMPSVGGYGGPIYLQLDQHDIWCGDAKMENCFLYFEEDIAFVQEKYFEDYLTNNEDEPFVFTYGKDETDEDHEGDCLCMDDDSCGFTFCSNGDGSHYKFRFKTNRKMTEEEAWQLALKYI